MSVGVFSGGNFINSLQAAGKNPVLNSNFSVWQRGTSIAIAASASGYSADRWCAASQGANGAMTVSRQATSDTTNLPNIQYCARVQRNSGQTGTSPILLVNSFESINSIPLAGKTVTMSFYARAGANFSTTGIGANIISGTGTDQNRAIVGYTGEVSITGSATLTTTWQRFTVSGIIPATATEIATYFSYTPTGTAGANDYFEVTGVQLEVGSTASAYAPNGATYQGELAACQRYYYRQNGTNNTPFGFGMSASTTSFRLSLPYKQPMRVSPSSIDFSGLQVVDTVSGYAVSNLVITAAGTDFADLTATSTGMTAQRAGWINGSGTCYIGLSAEL